MKYGSRRISPWLAGLAVTVAACTGVIGDAGTAGQQSEALCGGDSPMRRLTRFEYNNTVRDLLGDATRPADVFPPEEQSLGFDNQASTLTVGPLLAEELMMAAEGVSQRATVDLSALLGCSASTAGCIDSFITNFGKRAYRRPLTTDQHARLLSLFELGSSQWGATMGVQLVIQTTLQAPQFLYRVELGMPDPVQDDVVPLDSYEVASRLSYLLWGSMPDAELFSLANAGQLQTRQQIAEQARRMIEDDRARQAVAHFHRQWLRLDRVDVISKDQKTFPTFEPALASAWKEETERFIEHVIFDGEGDLTTLLTAPYSMMNATLTSHYGVSSSSEGFARVELDPNQRAGFLTHASVLAANAAYDRTSPVHRGLFVREQLLCELLPPPPNNVEAPVFDPNESIRKQFEAIAKEPSCATCHRLMNPIGFGFENYDGIGRWRDEEHGAPIDATGEVVGSPIGEFDGAVELAQALAASDVVRSCVVRQWFRYGYGRAETESDSCALDDLGETFRAANYDIKTLLVALTQTDAFLYRRAIQGGE